MARRATANKLRMKDYTRKGGHQSSPWPIAITDELGYERLAYNVHRHLLGRAEQNSNHEQDLSTVLLDWYTR
jgi:hypothetical protein